jgi:Transglutaminase-like superfamily
LAARTSRSHDNWEVQKRAMSHYALAGHVFVCLQGEHVVFLDVRKDRYFALEAAQTRGLGALVAGWPAAIEGARARAADSSEAVQSSVIALLLERGLLSADAQSGRIATPVTVESLTGELSADAYEELARPPVSTVRRFVACAASASFMLRFLGFERVVRRVSRRNQMHSASTAPAHYEPVASDAASSHAAAGPAADSLDSDRVHRLVATFASLRPFFFTAKDMCLFETFALSEFLARHGVFPRWVFGVQARPFAAHCWLQHGGIVINDTVDHVGRYAPIMVV